MTPTLPKGLREALATYLMVEHGYIKDGLAVALRVNQLESVIAPFFQAQPSVEQREWAKRAAEEIDKEADFGGAIVQKAAVEQITEIILKHAPRSPHPTVQGDKQYSSDPHDHGMVPTGEVKDGMAAWVPAEGATLLDKQKLGSIIELLVTYGWRQNVESLQMFLHRTAQQIRQWEHVVERETETPKEDWGEYQDALTFLLNWVETQRQEAKHELAAVTQERDAACDLNDAQKQLVDTCAREICVLRSDRDKLRDQLDAAIRFQDLWKIRALENENEAASLEGRVAALNAECLEQARLLGASGSIEAKLIAENEKLRGELNEAKECGQKVDDQLVAMSAALTALQAWEKQAREVCNSLAEYLRPGPIPTSEPTERDYLLADLNALLSTPAASGGTGT